MEMFTQDFKKSLIRLPVKISETDFQRIDALLPAFRQSSGDATATRSDAVRRIIELGMQAFSWEIEGIETQKCVDLLRISSLAKQAIDRGIQKIKDNEN